MNCADNKSFWDRTWKEIFPERVSAYAAGLGPDRDDIIAFLQDRGARRVCDAGCGCGVYALKMARHGFEVSGFDIAESAVALAKKLLSDNGYPAEKFRCASILATDYEDVSFDAVVARDVVDHMPIKQGMDAVNELLRIVRPGGYVILSLDAADGEYESEPHETNADGDYLFVSGKWSGMVFHPYSPEEISKLTAGHDSRLLSSDENGFTVLLGKQNDLTGK